MDGGQTVKQSSVARAPYRVWCGDAGGSIGRAVADLRRDFTRVGVPVEAATDAAAADVVVTVDPAIPGPEGYRVERHGRTLRIAGSDELGVIYGVYAVSHRVLGVDPFWFWKDLEPEPVGAAGIVWPENPIVGRPLGMRYRGWFLNDEDLLSKWKDGGGRRDLDYPFYEQVMAPGVLDAVCETLLRTGGNLIIPSSFVDVMNPAEARLVEAAVARGLYVTQHHIEPLGVSHFGYETYWRARGVTATLRYRDEPDRVRETWRAYAQRWWELAGERVIWQLGLRGRGDHAIWTADPSIGEDAAGRFISEAIADQWAIVQEVDPRPAPSATTTVWAECSSLFLKGQIEVPDGVAIIFCDEGSSQRMQDDFYETPREPSRAYGAYAHAAFWICGPHLAAGQSPAAAAAVLREIMARGDTHYAIVNTSNVREHVFPVDAWMRGMWGGPATGIAGFWSRHVPGGLEALGERYFAALVVCDDERVFQDGDGTAAVMNWLAGRGIDPNPRFKRATREALLAAADAMEAVARDAATASWPERYRTYARSHFVVPAVAMACIYRAVAALTQDDVAAAVALLKRMLTVRDEAAQQRFAGWYRGDDKADWPDLAAQLEARLNSPA